MLRSAKLVFVEYDAFEWDVGNFEKVQKHGISLLEIKYFFEQEVFVLRDHRHSTAESRFIAIGKEKIGRPLFVAFTFRKKENEIHLRVISARYIHCKGKEQDFYEKLKKSFKKTNRE